MDNTVVTRSENRDLTPAEIELLATLVIDEPDHYTVLGLERSALVSDINTAYCRAVEFFHPLKYSHLLESNNVLHWKLSSAYTRVVEAFDALKSLSPRGLRRDAQSPDCWMGAFARTCTLNLAL